MEWRSEENYYFRRVDMRNIKLYFLFFKLQIKQLIEYKSDFAVGLLSVLLNQINTFLLTIVVFMQIDSLMGYSIMEIFLMYGFFVLVKGIDLFYNDNIWNFAWVKVKDGSFLTILLRPINPIFYIIMERININGLSESIIGLCIVIISLWKMHIVISLLDFLVICVFIICGLTVYFSIKLLFSAPAFRTKSCGEFMTAGMQIGDVAKYPIELYKNKIVRRILLYVLPFPITSYLPAIYCIQKVRKVIIIDGIEWFHAESFIPYALIISVVLFAISFIIWNRELRKYEPTGT